MGHHITDVVTSLVHRAGAAILALSVYTKDLVYNNAFRRVDRHRAGRRDFDKPGASIPHCCTRTIGNHIWEYNMYRDSLGAIGRFGRRSKESWFGDLGPNPNLNAHREYHF